MSDYYPYMEHFNHRAQEWAERAAEDRVATEVVRTRRARAREARDAARTSGRTVRGPVLGRLRSRWSS